MPFVFLTALTDRDNELKGRQLGADDYVTKPIDFDMLAAIITARLAGVARSGLWPKAIALNEREVEVLTWAARGKTSAEIAQNPRPDQADGRFPHRQCARQARRRDPHRGGVEGGNRPADRAVRFCHQV